MRGIAVDGGLLRRAARWGSRRAPWFVRIAAPLAGLSVMALAPAPRRQIAENLRRIRGRRGPLGEAWDVARTFTLYAACVADTLAAGSAHAREPRVTVRGEGHLRGALAAGRGVVLVTAHTAGWEIVGPRLARDVGVPVLIAVSAERDAAAGAIQDEARRALGVAVVHVGDDPLAALPLVDHLRGGGIVALQLDRAPPGLRRRAVTLFGAPGHLPEGPLRLASITGAPLLPVFASRPGPGAYAVDVYPPVAVPPRARDEALDAAAAALARTLEAFLGAHPTQWFHFRDGADGPGPAAG